MQHYQRTATTVAGKIQKGAAGKQIVIHHMVLTATATGTVLFTDGDTANDRTVDVAVGMNEFCMPMIFKPEADVTITPTGATVSVFAEYTHK